MEQNTEHDADLNNGVQIILNRMKTNPEEFFDDGGRWRWIFNENMRDVMTEIEKAALYEALKTVRRAELTAKAAATILRVDKENEDDEDYEEKTDTRFWGWKDTEPKKLVVNRAQMELMKKLGSQVPVTKGKSK